MSGEPDTQRKTERLHMLISPDELERIDDWRFENRVGTRAEAIRRLTQLALRVDGAVEPVYHKTKEIGVLIQRGTNLIEESIRADPPDYDTASKVALVTLSDLIKQFSAMTLELRGMVEQVRRLRSPGEIVDLTHDLDQIREEAKRQARMMRLAIKGIEAARASYLDEEDDEDEGPRS